MLPASIPVTFFTDHAATMKREERLTADDLAWRIGERVAPDKKKLPWLKLAQFGDLRTKDKNSLRHNANVLRICGVEGDYDGEKIGFDAACSVAREAGLACTIYTSPSHTPDKPRWRVLAPTSEPRLPAERDKLMARLNGLYGGVFSGESFTLSPRRWCTGPPGQGARWRMHRHARRADEIAIYKKPEANGHDPDYEPKAADDLRASDVADVFAALSILPNEGEAEWNGWKHIALAVRAAIGGGDTGFLAFDYWSKKNPAYNAATTQECWAEVSARPGNGAAWGS